MDLEERIGWLLLGMAIGYIIRTLQEIKRDIHEVDEIMKRDKDEGGFMRNPYIANTALLIVLVLCVWASFTTQKTNNQMLTTNNRLEMAIEDIRESDIEAEKTRARLNRITICSQEYLSRTIVALNQRTTYTQEQADANVELQLAQRDFLATVTSIPPITDAEAEEALRNYVERLKDFAEASEKNRKKGKKYAYPTSQELQHCLNEDS